MKYLDMLRSQRAAVEARRDAALDAIEAVAAAAVTEARSLSADDDTKVAEHDAEVRACEAELAPLDEKIAEYEAVEARTQAIAERPVFQVVRKPDVSDVVADRAATPTQLADALTRAVEPHTESPENMAHARSIFRRHASDGEWARGLAVRASDTYTSAWAKKISGRDDALTTEERTALSSVTNANGNYLLPTHLDPTVMLSNDGCSNAVRQLARVVTVTGDTSWQGITSAGVSASWDGQLTEVSDDSPTFAQPTVDTHTAQAFVQAAIAFTEDVNGLASEILMMFADAKDRLEGAAHCTGSGSGQPWGIFTALDANTNVEITSTTAATIGVVDLHSVYRQVPVRFRGKGTWLMNPLYSLAIKALGTAVSASFTNDLTAAPTGVLLGKRVVESDEAPTTQTTTALDNEIVFGDFSNYVIVDKPGSMSVEYIPHLFNTANNLPDGRRGWYARWRTGADSVLDTAFRLLQDKTSA